MKQGQSIPDQLGFRCTTLQTRQPVSQTDRPTKSDTYYLPTYLLPPPHQTKQNKTISHPTAPAHHSIPSHTYPSPTYLSTRPGQDDSCHYQPHHPSIPPALPPPLSSFLSRLYHLPSFLPAFLSNPSPTTPILAELTRTNITPSSRYVARACERAGKVDRSLGSA